MEKDKRYNTPEKEFIIVMNGKDVLAWSFDQIDRKFGCAECCTGDRCDDDCKKINRKNCPYCKGTGWIPEKEIEAVASKHLKEYHAKAKNRRIQMFLAETALGDKSIYISTKRLIDFKTRNIVSFETTLSIETFMLLKDMVQHFINDKRTFEYLQEEMKSVDKSATLHIKYDKDFYGESIIGGKGTAQPGVSFDQSTSSKPDDGYCHCQTGAMVNHQTKICDNCGKIWRNG